VGEVNGKCPAAASSAAVGSAKDEANAALRAWGKNAGSGSGVSSGPVDGNAAGAQTAAFGDVPPPATEGAR
jgi:hypothetical protein